jgi:hypothetical protein
VRRFLKLLETEQQIIQQKDRYITTIITIINYDNYQDDNKTIQQTIQQKDSRRYINKKENNDNNEDKTTHERTNLLKTSSFKWKRELRQHREKGGKVLGDCILIEKDGLKLLMRKDETGKKIWQPYEDYKKLKLTK